MPATICLPSLSFRPSSVSRIDFGWPGRLMMSERLRTTATWRDRIAVGTNSRPILRICSPNPGMSLSATASVASGVTSRGAGPVPPVVSTRWQPTMSTSSISVRSIEGWSSGMSLVSIRHGDVRATVNQSRSPGIPWSSYTPAEARSETDTRPIRSVSSMFERLQLPIELPVSARRAAARALVASLRDQRAKKRAIEPRIGGGEIVERRGLGDQPLAPALERVQPRGVLASVVRPCVEPLPDRLGIDVAHQPAHELQLPLAAAPCGNASRRDDRIDEPLGQRNLGGDLREARRIEFDQSLAEILQPVHFGLAARFRRRPFGFGDGLIGRRPALAEVGCGHVSEGSGAGETRRRGKVGGRLLS